MIEEKYLPHEALAEIWKYKVLTELEWSTFYKSMKLFLKENPFYLNVHDDNTCENEEQHYKETVERIMCGRREHDLIRKDFYVFFLIQYISQNENLNLKKNIMKKNQNELHSEHPGENDDFKHTCIAAVELFLEKNLKIVRKLNLREIKCPICRLEAIMADHHSCIELNYYLLGTMTAWLNEDKPFVDYSKN